MTETRSNTQFNEKLAILARTTKNHDHEIHEINQKLDAMTTILRRLNEEARGSIQLEVAPGNGSTIMVPKSLKLEFPRFKGEDLVCLVYKANQYF